MRFIVVGTSGSGKSTFANALSKAMNCPCIELDRFYWGPNWAAVPAEEFERAVCEATMGERWVADGNYGAVRELLWSRATHIVWLNFGRATVFSRVFWRTVSHIIKRTELFNGNRESLRMAFLSRKSVLLWSFTTFSRNRIKFSALRDDPGFSHLQWLEITEPSRVNAVIRSLSRAED